MLLAQGPQLFHRLVLLADLGQHGHEFFAGCSIAGRELQHHAVGGQRRVVLAELEQQLGIAAVDGDPLRIFFAELAVEFFEADHVVLAAHHLLDLGEDLAFQPGAGTDVVERRCIDLDRLCCGRPPDGKCRPDAAAASR